MRLLLFFIFILCLATSHAVFAVDEPGVFSLSSAPADSKTIPGFVTFASNTTLWDVEATHVISVHRSREKPEDTLLVIDVPLTIGQTHTQVIIHENIMKYENVLRFVQGLRFKPKQ